MQPKAERSKSLAPQQPSLSNHETQLVQAYRLMASRMKQNRCKQQTATRERINREVSCRNLSYESALEC